MAKLPASTRKKILLLLPSYDSGGAEGFALRLIQHAGNLEFDWHVTTGNRRHLVLQKAFNKSGAITHFASPGAGNLSQLIAFLRFLRLHKFDAIMTFTGVFGGLALGLSRLIGMPCRVAWHRRSTPAYQPTLGRRIYARFSLGLLDWGSTRILSNSKVALDNYHGARWEDRKKFAVIPNGVDANRFKPRPEARDLIRKELGISAGTKVIGHVGRFDPAKDHATLILIVKELRNYFNKTCLLLAGTGTDGEAVAKSLRTAGIDNITLALGVRHDVDRIFNAMDVFVFPSVTEGQPNALIEAMLCGVPVVASDIPGIREAVPPAMASRLFPPRDVRTAIKHIELAISDFDFAKAQLKWVRERYDLARNLDLALREAMTKTDDKANA